MRYLLDTNVVSELKKPRPHGAVVQWLNRYKGEFALPSPVAGEIQSGIEKARKNDPAKATQFSKWLEDLLTNVPVVPMGADEFREWARMMQGNQAHLYIDAMIAATARVHGMTVATRNVADFEPFDVPVANPFE